MIRRRRGRRFEGRTCPTWAIAFWTAIVLRPSECDGRPFVKRLCPGESGEARRRQALLVVVRSRPLLSAHKRQPHSHEIEARIQVVDSRRLAGEPGGNRT